MAVDYCDPLSDWYARWQTTGSPHAAQVDDAVRQPTNPGSSTYINAIDGDDNDEEWLYMDNTVVNIEEATNITFWANLKRLGADWTLGMNISLNSVFKGWSNVTPATSQGWHSLSWNGSWTQANIDDLRVGLKASGSLGKTDIQYCYEVYCVITYTEPAEGYAHDVNGVAAANIGKVMGVLTANIGKVMGI